MATPMTPSSLWSISRISEASLSQSTCCLSSTLFGSLVWACVRASGPKLHQAAIARVTATVFIVLDIGQQSVTQGRSD